MWSTFEGGSSIMICLWFSYNGERLFILILNLDISIANFCCQFQESFVSPINYPIIPSGVKLVARFSIVLEKTTTLSQQGLVIHWWSGQNWNIILLKLSLIVEWGLMLFVNSMGIEIWEHDQYLLPRPQDQKFKDIWQWYYSNAAIILINNNQTMNLQRKKQQHFVIMTQQT